MAQSTSKSTTIPATAAEVLDVIAELADYPQWAGGITKVDVLEEVDGWPMRARFTMEQPPVSDTYVLDYTWDVDESGQGTVSWTLTERGTVLQKLDGAYQLTQRGDSTDVTYSLSVDITLPLPGMVRKAAEKKIIGTALDDLSARASG
ncbi:MAG: SRPBCC family protein [Actinomycetales bacterium]